MINEIYHSYIKKLPLRLILTLALVSASLFIFAVIVNEVLWEKEEEADNAIFDFITKHFQSEGFTRIMEAATYLASSIFLQVAYGALFVLHLLLRKFKKALQVIIVGAGGYAVVYLMKLMFRRDRPDDPLIDPLQNFSFPSGHATSGFIFYGLLAYLAWSTKLPVQLRIIIGVLMLVICLLIGFSRIYLRVHFPSDVLAGFCLGFAWLLGNIYFFEKAERAKKLDTTT